jgi:hypothetical protein
MDRDPITRQSRAIPQPRGRSRKNQRGAIDFHEAKAATEAAIAEAGLDDFDVSYLTEENFEAAVRHAREVNDDAIAAYGPDATPGCNYLYNVWFTGGPGSKFYGYLGSAGGRCASSWHMTGEWQSRSVHRKCASLNAYLWKVC